MQTAKYNAVPGCPRVEVLAIDYDKAVVRSDEAAPGHALLIVPVGDLSSFEEGTDDAARMADALTQIREVADFPLGTRLTDKADQLAWAMAKLERIGNIAGDGRPDEDWPGREPLGHVEPARDGETGRYYRGAVDAGDMSTSDGLGGDPRRDEGNQALLDRTHGATQAEDWTGTSEAAEQIASDYARSLDPEPVSDAAALDRLAAMAKAERSAADIAQEVYTLLTRTGR